MTQKISFEKFKKLLLAYAETDKHGLKAVLDNRFKAWQIVNYYDYISNDIRTLHCSAWQVCRRIGISTDTLYLILYGLCELRLATKVSKDIYKL